MRKQMLQEVLTTTHRNFIGGSSPDQHKQLISHGWYHDKFANQYRKISGVEKLYVGGVEVETVSAAENAA